MTDTVRLNEINEAIDSITLACDSDSEWHEVALTTSSGKEYKVIKTCGTIVHHTTYVAEPLIPLENPLNSL